MVDEIAGQRRRQTKQRTGDAERLAAAMQRDQVGGAF